MSEFLSAYMGYVMAALAVLVLVIVAIMVVRANRSRPGKGRGGRLGVSDVYDLANNRQLMLVRRDGVEHLLLIGGEHDVVVERNIAVERDDEADPAFFRSRSRRQQRAEEQRIGNDEPVLTPAAQSPPQPRREVEVRPMAPRVPVAEEPGEAIDMAPPPPPRPVAGERPAVRVVNPESVD